MTAYELRRHLATGHNIAMFGADYGTLLAAHDAGHGGGADHGHEDGPGSRQWAAECAEFGCHEERTDGP